ncbi:MAG: hypothetical protein PHC70_04325 [Patescibacteria group bacterium]|nr:hypothetical protein [Patescibacteria group bacterium]
MLIDPTEQDLRQHLLPHVAEKVLHHLDSETGSLDNDYEVQCMSVANVLWTTFDLHVVYRTKRRNPKTGEVTEGAQFVLMRHFHEMMRALLVTQDGYVVMQREYRRTAGRWMDMHCAGGTKKNEKLDTLISEMISETGCRPSSQSTIWSLRKSVTDDGPLCDPLNYLAVDMVKAPVTGTHQNVEDSIKGVVFIPFEEWREKALNGEYDDPFSENFAARCTLNPDTKRLIVRGSAQVLRHPKDA